MRMSLADTFRRVEALTRLAAGQTQTQAAEAVGRSPRTIQRWVAEHRLGVAIPNVHLARVVERAYETERHARARADLLLGYMKLASAEVGLRREELRLVPTPLPRLGRTEPHQSNREFLDAVLPGTDQDTRRAAAINAARVLPANRLV